MAATRFVRGRGGAAAGLRRRRVARAVRSRPAPGAAARSARGNGTAEDDCCLRRNPRAMRTRAPGPQLSLGLLRLLAAAALASGRNDFCEDKELLRDRQHSNLSWGRATNLVDHGVLSHYMELHCCAFNYDTIEWYKDGVRLLSDNTHKVTEVTTFTDAKARNQTLVSQGLLRYDAGNYTCVVRSGKLELKKTTRLQTRDFHTSEPPEMTVIPQDQWAKVGETAHLYCEGFLGHGSKDTKIFGVVQWQRLDGSDVITEEKTNIEVKNFNRSGNIYGQTLIFKPVKSEDFKQYKCLIQTTRGKHEKIVRLHEGWDPNTKVRTTYKGTILVLSVFLALLLLLSSAGVHWHLEIRLLWKDRFGKLEESDERQYDVFVCYDETDAEFVMGTLVPMLERQCQYKCFAWERDSLAGDWIPETYVQSVQQSRRFLLVLSPALAKNSWCTFALYVAIDAMLRLHSRIICVMLQKIQWSHIQQIDDDASNSTLRQVLRVVRTVEWEAGRERDAGTTRFWHRLRLHLPPRRKLPLHIKMPADMCTLTTPSVDSLTTLLTVDIMQQESIVL